MQQDSVWQEVRAGGRQQQRLWYDELPMAKQSVFTHGTILSFQQLMAQSLSPPGRVLSSGSPVRGDFCQVLPGNTRLKPLTTIGRFFSADTTTAVEITGVFMATLRLLVCSAVC